MFRRLGRLLLTFIAVLAVALVTMGVVAAAAGFAGAKSKPTTTVSVGSQATLAQSPFGPGVNVSVTYNCFPGFDGKGGYGGGAFGDVQVTDLQGDQGFAVFSPTCNDTKQTTIVFVPGFFNAGAGAVSAFVCGFDCSGATREIKIS